MNKFGFVAVIGRPNAGKSSIINRLVGEKVAIVSPKSQTTRDRIRGILNGEGFQIVFVDTPGIHKSKNKLSDYMLKNVKEATVDTDVILVVIDGVKGLTDADIDIIGKYSAKKTVVAYNKIDAVGYERSYPDIEKLSAIKNIDAVIPLSAKKGTNTDLLLDALLKHIPKGEPMYPTDEYTDKDLRFIVAETVREKALMYLGEEIPHGVGVVIASFEENDERCDINADIVCEKSSHKPIIIGKGGEVIKKIGQSARFDVEKLLGKKVRLELFVKVKQNWRDKPSAMKDIGYNPKN